MKKILFIITMLLFVGCADKAQISCPDCTISNEAFDCKGCTVEAEVTKPFDLGKVLDAVSDR